MKMDSNKEQKGSSCRSGGANSSQVPNQNSANLLVTEALKMENKEEHISRFNRLMYEPIKGANEDEREQDEYNKKRKAEMDAQTVVHLAMNCHNRPTHCLEEFLQNTRDAQSALQNKKIPNQKYRLNIRLYDRDLFADVSAKAGEALTSSHPFYGYPEGINHGTMIFAYDELGWEPENIEALCKLRVSTKHKRNVDSRYVGEKGQGFYSLFRIATDAVVICPKTHYQIYLSENPNMEHFGRRYTVPHWFDANRIPPEIRNTMEITSPENCYTSCVSLRLGKTRLTSEKTTKDAFIRLEPVNSYEQLGKALMEIPEENFIFMDVPRRISICIPAVTAKSKRSSLFSSTECSAGVDADISMLEDLGRTKSGKNKRSKRKVKDTDLDALDELVGVQEEEKTKQLAEEGMTFERLVEKKEEHWNMEDKIQQKFADMKIWLEMLESSVTYRLSEKVEEVHVTRKTYFMTSTNFDLPSELLANLPAARPVARQRSIELAFLLGKKCDEPSMRSLASNPLEKFEVDFFKKSRDEYCKNWCGAGEQKVKGKKGKSRVPTGKTEDLADSKGTRGVKTKSSSAKNDVNNEGKHISLGELKDLSCCLPIEAEHVGLPCLVNGDFLLVASREQLDKAGERGQWNKAQLAEVPRCIAKTIEALAHHPIHWREAVVQASRLHEALLNTDRKYVTINELSSNLCEKVWNLVKSANFVPVGYGDDPNKFMFVTPDKARVIDVKFFLLLKTLYDDERIASELKKHNVVHPDILSGDEETHKRKADLLKKLGAKPLDPETYLNIVYTSDSEKALLDPLVTDRSWWVEWMQFLDDLKGVTVEALCKGFFLRTSTEMGDESKLVCMAFAGEKYILYLKHVDNVEAYKKLRELPTKELVPLFVDGSISPSPKTGMAMGTGKNRDTEEDKFLFKFMTQKLCLQRFDLGGFISKTIVMLKTLSESGDKAEAMQYQTTNVRSLWTLLPVVKEVIASQTAIVRATEIRKLEAAMASYPRIIRNQQSRPLQICQTFGDKASEEQMQQEGKAACEHDHEYERLDKPLMLPVCCGVWPYLLVPRSDGSVRWPVDVLSDVYFFQRPEGMDLQTAKTLVVRYLKIIDLPDVGVCHLEAFRNIRIDLPTDWFLSGTGFPPESLAKEVAEKFDVQFETFCKMDLYSKAVAWSEERRDILDRAEERWWEDCETIDYLVLQHEMSMDLWVTEANLTMLSDEFIDENGDERMVASSLCDVEQRFKLFHDRRRFQLFFEWILANYKWMTSAKLICSSDQNAEHTESFCSKMMFYLTRSHWVLVQPTLPVSSEEAYKNVFRKVLASQAAVPHPRLKELCDIANLRLSQPEVAVNIEDEHNLTETPLVIEDMTNKECPSTSEANSSARSTDEETCFLNKGLNTKGGQEPITVGLFIDFDPDYNRNCALDTLMEDSTFAHELGLVTFSDKYHIYFERLTTFQEELEHYQTYKNDHGGKLSVIDCARFAIFELPYLRVCPEDLTLCLYLCIQGSGSRETRISEAFRKKSLLFLGGQWYNAQRLIIYNDEDMEEEANVAGFKTLQDLESPKRFSDGRLITFYRETLQIPEKLPVRCFLSRLMVFQDHVLDLPLEKRQNLLCSQGKQLFEKLYQRLEGLDAVQIRKALQSHTRWWLNPKTSWQGQPLVLAENEAKGMMKYSLKVPKKLMCLLGADNGNLYDAFKNTDINFFYKCGTGNNAQRAFVNTSLASALGIRPLHTYLSMAATGEEVEDPKITEKGSVLAPIHKMWIIGFFRKAFSEAEFRFFYESGLILNILQCKPKWVEANTLRLRYAADIPEIYINESAHCGANESNERQENAASANEAAFVPAALPGSVSEKHYESQSFAKLCVFLLKNMGKAFQELSRRVTMSASEERKSNSVVDKAEGEPISFDWGVELYLDKAILLQDSERTLPEILAKAEVFRAIVERLQEIPCMKLHAKQNFLENPLSEVRLGNCLNFNRTLAILQSSASTGCKLLSPQVVQECQKHFDTTEENWPDTDSASLVTTTADITTAFFEMSDRNDSSFAVVQKPEINSVRLQDGVDSDGRISFLLEWSKVPLASSYSICVYCVKNRKTLEKEAESQYTATEDDKDKGMEDKGMEAKGMEDKGMEDTETEYVDVLKKPSFSIACVDIQGNALEDKEMNDVEGLKPPSSLVETVDNQGNDLESDDSPLVEMSFEAKNATNAVVVSSVAPLHEYRIEVLANLLFGDESGHPSAEMQLFTSLPTPTWEEAFLQARQTVEETNTLEVHLVFSSVEHADRYEIQIVLGGVPGTRESLYYDFNKTIPIVIKAPKWQDGDRTVDVVLPLEGLDELRHQTLHMRVRAIPSSSFGDERFTSEWSLMQHITAKGFVLQHEVPRLQHIRELRETEEKLSQQEAELEKNAESHEKFGNRTSHAPTDLDMIEGELGDSSDTHTPDERSRVINFVLGNTFASEATGKISKGLKREVPLEKDFFAINKQFAYVGKDQFILIKKEFWNLYGGVIFRVVDRIDRVDSKCESYFKARNWFIPAYHTFLNSCIADNPTICLHMCDPQYLECLTDEVLFSHCVGPVQVLFYLPWEARRLLSPVGASLFDPTTGEFQFELYATRGLSANVVETSGAEADVKTDETAAAEAEAHMSTGRYATFWCAFAITKLESRFSLQAPLFNICIEPLITLKEGQSMYDQQDVGLRKMYRIACNQLNEMKECKQIRHAAADIFSGAGGASTGYEMAGFNIHWAVERNPAAAKIWELNHPRGRMYSVDVYDVLEDIQRGAHNMPAPLTLGFLAGSSPCQGFSSVNIKGGALDIANRGLIHAVENYIHALQPMYAAFENVTGMLSSKKGKVSDFFRFLTGILQTGYGIRTKIVNSLECSCPTERRRVICVANRWDVPSYKFGPSITTRAPGEYVSVRDAIEDLPHFKGPGCGDYLWHYLGRDSPSLKPTTSEKPLEVQLIIKDDSTTSEGEGMVKTVSISKKGLSPFAREMRKGNEKLQILTAHQVYNSDNQLPPPVNMDSWTPTILTIVDQWQSTHPLDGRFYSVREVARLMTFPDVFRFEQLSEVDYYKMLGNSVPPFVARYVGNTMLDSDFPSLLKKVKHRGEPRNEMLEDAVLFQESEKSIMKRGDAGDFGDVPLVLPPRMGSKKAQSRKKLPVWMKQNC